MKISEAYFLKTLLSMFQEFQIFGLKLHDEETFFLSTEIRETLYDLNFPSVDGTDMLKSYFNKCSHFYQPVLFRSFRALLTK